MYFIKNELIHKFNKSYIIKFLKSIKIDFIFSINIDLSGNENDKYFKVL